MTDATVPLTRPHADTTELADPTDPAAVADRVRHLREVFGDPSADVAMLLCDRHPAEQVALTMVDASGQVSTSRSAS